MLYQKDSIIALSSTSPTDPKEGMSPASRIRSVNDHEVNWASSTGGSNTCLLN